MNIVILDGYAENPGDLSWDGFARLGALTVYDRTPAGEIAPRIGRAEIVITNKTPVTAATLAACPNIRYIGCLSTGYNVVDTAAAKAGGIPVTNIPAYSTAAVAQMVFAHLLAVCNHAEAHSAAVFRGDWANCPDFCFWNYPLVELAGKTMGILGFGRIGQAVARLARAFGMEVLAYDHHPKAEPGDLAKYVSLDELYARSDVLTLHCPLTDETTGIINRGSLAKMKTGAILINTARGPLVAEEDLAAALRTGKIGHACLDVVSAEPISPGNPLLTAPNCQITPHIAWAARESRQRLMDQAVENLRAFLTGEPVNVVN